MNTQKFLVYILLFISGFIGFIYINSIKSISFYCYFGLAIIMISSAVLGFIEYDRYSDSKCEESLIRKVMSENQRFIAILCLLLTFIISAFSAQNNVLIKILPVMIFVIGMIILIWKPSKKTSINKSVKK